MKKIITYLICAFALVTISSCNDDLDIRQAYPFKISTMPVPKKLVIGETAEIRCQLHREGYYSNAKYQIRYFQPDGKGEFKDDEGTVFLPNDFYELKKETFRLYYTSMSEDQQVIDITVSDNFGQIFEFSFSFNNDSKDKEDGDE